MTTLPRAIAVLERDAWDPAHSAGAVTLDLDHRQRRRIRLSDDRGRAFLLDLPKAVTLRPGQGLALDSGDVLAVRAAPEPIADLRCTDAVHLARLAWHLGNRHTPVQVVDATTLRIRDDHTLTHMAEGLGAAVTRRTAPFEPEPGAYSAGHGHGHGHHYALGQTGAHRHD